jgi:hypothetical protein
VASAAAVGQVATLSWAALRLGGRPSRPAGGVFVCAAKKWQRIHFFGRLLDLNQADVSADRPTSVRRRPIGCPGLVVEWLAGAATANRPTLAPTQQAAGLLRAPICVGHIISHKYYTVSAHPHLVARPLRQQHLQQDIVALPLCRPDGRAHDCPALELLLTSQRRACQGGCAPRPRRRLADLDRETPARSCWPSSLPAGKFRPRRQLFARAHNDTRTDARSGRMPRIRLARPHVGAATILPARWALMKSWLVSSGAGGREHKKMSYV